MQIGLINAYSTLNLGDAAIYSAFRKLLPQVELVACVQDKVPDPSLGINFLDQRPRDCAAYISVGGDIFNNSREWLVTKAFLLNLAELRRKPLHTILFGQSIPRSCHGLSFFLLRQCLLNLAAVCVRDLESYQKLRKAGVDARLSYDIAFVLEGSASAKETAKKILSQKAIDPAKTAVFSVRGFDSMYSHDNAQFIERMTQLSLKLQEQGYQPLILIQSRAYGADNDLDVAQAIQRGAPGTEIFDPFLDDQSVPSWQLAMALFSLVDLVIAVRFHTAVLSLAAGRVPFHLHYSNKGRDLCHRLELPGCDLSQFNPATEMPTILASSGRSFDHSTIREQVNSDFRWCLDQLPGKQLANAIAGRLA
ncbi:polysaccharide pyruvyl transferase family protein [Synechococcus sp. CS-1328]|uniref:polysaccharide pyruvyl transferase family protein n=1 Tax=Synechococcus sp. CS-1328 TaxID=2847976 RepID=UPI00223A708C|nr:polysaccharide pyruvyl transferase family protein [Synechococcus sp. CS-1328]